MRPVPTSECIESALSRSPDLKVVRKLPAGSGQHPGYIVEVRDSTTRDSTRVMSLVRDDSRSSAGSITAIIGWRRFTRPDSITVLHAVDAARTVVTRIVQVCAPQTAMNLSCDFGDGRPVPGCPAEN